MRRQALRRETRARLNGGALGAHAREIFWEIFEGQPYMSRREALIGERGGHLPQQARGAAAALSGRRITDGDWLFG